jgi:hypothetical protein
MDVMKFFNYCQRINWILRIRFDNRLRYSLKKEFIEQVRRSICRITENGTNYVEVICIFIIYIS